MGKKKINHSQYVSMGILKIRTALESVFSYGIAMKWSIPVGK